ncbi:MAG: glycoside hydrolase family 57 protein [Bacteroidales bacterium]|nr:glycoside hydrolase family 57 protein [Bacteroidales bacterium]
MNNICVYFQIHQPFRLKQYRFFEIGNDHYYFDDYLNKRIMRKVANQSYLPANELFMRLAEKYPDRFKIAFSITGIALDQFELYAPEVIESFQKLARTGQVEFLAETYSHSLVALKNEEEFVSQVNRHSDKIFELFGQRPAVFRNTELVYDDSIGEKVAKMGFKGMLGEGAKHILGWKSPNFLYYNVVRPQLKLLLRNFKLSDDIAFRFSNQAWSEWPLTAEKYLHWIGQINPDEDVANLFMDYETFGEHQSKESGIFYFLDAFFSQLIEKTDITLLTPSEVLRKFQPVAPLPVPFPTSWADEERDLSAWLGNELQKEAFSKLYSLRNDVMEANDPDLTKDWAYLQASDHFYYMSTKFFSDQAVHNYFNPYSSPYDAFINYMNVLSDFILRLEQSLDRDKHEGIPLEDLEDEKVKDAIDHYSRVLKKLRKRKKELDKQDLSPFDSKQ